MIKRILYVFLLMFVASATFAGVFFYDQPVHEGLAKNINNVCVFALMRGPDPKGDEIQSLGQEIYRRPAEVACDCIAPSTRNKMTYIAFAENIWEVSSLMWTAQGKAERGQKHNQKEILEYRQVIACVKQLADAMGIARKYDPQAEN